MSEGIIQSTIQVLRPYFFAMPFMDEKYFTRPPIKFLALTVAGIAHVRKGFLSGLFTAEQLRGDFPDRHEKHGFFVVLKRYVELLIGETVDVRARSIITGQEVDKTLLFLQTVVRAAENPVIPFDEALAQVKGRNAQEQATGGATIDPKQITIERLRGEGEAARAEVAKLRDLIRQKDETIEWLRTNTHAEGSGATTAAEMPGCRNMTKMNAFKFEKADLPGRSRLSGARSVRRFKPTGRGSDDE
jgi:hypothetical protein